MGEPFGLPVQGLAILFNGEHGDQSEPGLTKRDRMERRWRRADLLAYLHDPVGASAGEGGRGLDGDPFTRQMVGERLLHRVATRQGAHRAGFIGRVFCGQYILG